MDRNDVVNRLKAEQQQDSVACYRAGKDAGRLWAEERATPKELERIAAYIATSNTQNGYWYDVDHPGWMAPFGAMAHFAFAARPQEEQSGETVEHFWTNALVEFCYADLVADSNFLHGFGDGVVELWNEVRLAL